MASADGAGTNGLANAGFTARTLVTLAIAPLLLVFLKTWLFPKLDPREPPALQPKVPFIGHIISLIRENTAYYARL